MIISDCIYGVYEIEQVLEDLIIERSILCQSFIRVEKFVDRSDSLKTISMM
jgi:hypothetical protein